MTSFSFSSLRVRLLLLVLLAVIPAFGLIVYTAWELRLDAAARAKEEALKLARYAAMEQRQLIAETRRLLSELSQQSDVESAEPTTCPALLADQLKKHPRYSNLGVIDLDGNRTCSGLPAKDPGYLYLGDRSYFRKTVETRDFSIGEYQIGRTSGKATVGFGYPLLDDRGSLHGVVFATLDLTWLNQLLVESHLSPGSVLVVIDHNGTILAHSTKAEKWIGKTMSQDPIIRAVLAQQRQTVIEGSSLDGIQRLYAFTSLLASGETAAYVGIGIPREVAYANAKWTLVRNLLLLGLVTVLALVAAWFGGDLFILCRVNALVSATKRLAAGDLGARTGLSYGKGELSQLAQSFDAMGEALQTREGELRYSREEVQRNLERIGALREIDQAITSTLDLRTVLDVLLEKIEIFLPYSTATVRLFNKESDLLEPVACRNLDEKEWKVAPWRAGRGPANVVFESKAPLVIPNCLNDPRVKDPEFFRKHRLVSYLGVPMVAKEEILGVLSFYTKEEHEFSNEEVEFLSTLSGQAAIAIHNSRLYEETERRRREAEELARVAQSLTESLDMAAVGERIVTSVREIFGVRASMLRLLQADGSLRAIASSGESFSQTSRSDALPLGMGLASVAVAEGRPIWSADVLNEPRIRLTDQMRDYQLRSGNRSMIAVPLRAHEKIIGALALMDQTGRIYSDSEVALLQTFADQAALALENARLYEETRAREAQLQETNRMLSALHSVAAAASQSLDLDRVLQAAIEKIIEIFRFDATGIYIYDEQMNELLLRVSLASDRERFTQPRSFVGGQGIVGKVVESGKPSIFEDIETDPLYQQLSRTKSAKQLGHRFFTVFPVKGKLKNVGALTCMGGAPRRLNSNEIQLLEAVTDQIAVAIENSQLYGEMVKLAADLSRSNKVRDEFLSVMSHELRTPLNVVMGYTGMIKDRMLGEINPEQEKALEKVISRARDQLTMISSILQATQLEAEGVKVESQEFGLGDFLGDLRSSYEGSFGKELTLIWDYPSDLPVIKTDSEKLKHILQNLINNAIKFTEKGSVKISARCLPDFQIAEFKVSDTGIGIAKEFFPVIFERFRQVDSSETRAYGGVGIGLYIVKRFTELLGGKVEVESEPGKGSTFTVTIPCESYQSVVGQQGLMTQGRELIA